MRYFVLAPEVAGSLGNNTVMSRERHPPTVSRLHYEFDVWLGDDLLEAFPCFIVSQRLADKVARLKLSGASIDVVEVTLSEQYRDLYPDRRIPEFLWLKVSGAAGRDDFGTDVAGRLVVSEQVMELLKTMDVDHCSVIPVV